MQSSAVPDCLAMALVSALLLLSSPPLLLASCPPSLGGLAGAFGESPALGCVFADAEEGEQFDSYDKALARCRWTMPLSMARQLSGFCL